MIEIHAADLVELIEDAMNRGRRWERGKMNDNRLWSQWRDEVVANGIERATQRKSLRGSPDRVKVARAEVAGAIASLMRETASDDPSYPGIRKAYEVALQAAGLIPEPPPGV